MVADWFYRNRSTFQKRFQDSPGPKMGAGFQKQVPVRERVIVGENGKTRHE